MALQSLVERLPLFRHRSSRVQHNDSITLPGTANSRDEYGLAGAVDERGAAELLSNLGQLARETGVYGIWSWRCVRTSSVRYMVLHSLEESNDFEFLTNPLICERTKLWEKGIMTAAGRELVDGPDWRSCDEAFIANEYGGDLAQALRDAIYDEDPVLLHRSLTAGADPDTLMVDGWTALSRVIADGKPAVLAQLLLEAGADIHRKTPCGENPVSLALSTHNTDVFNMLRRIDR